jgi:hypothetical protein
MICSRHTCLRPRGHWDQQVLVPRQNKATARCMSHVFTTHITIPGSILHMYTTVLLNCKTKSSLCLMKHHTIRRMREWSYNSTRFNLGIKWKRVICFTLRTFYLREIRPLKGSSVAPRTCLDVADKRNIRASPGYRTRVVWTVTRKNTDWTVPTHTHF